MTLAFTSRIPLVEQRIGAAAIYCSDGRIGQQMDDFLHNALNLPRYDRLVVPGGPGCLAGHFVAYREEQALVEHLRFLCRVHEIERVVLIAHQHCAFYIDRLELTRATMLKQQVTDLSNAARRIAEVDSKLQVDGYLALLEDGRVRFQPVAVGEGR